MDVDGLAARAFAALAHGFDLNEIVVVGGQRELHGRLVGQDGGDVVVAVALQQHLREREEGRRRMQITATVILRCECRSESGTESGPTK